MKDSVTTPLAIGDRVKVPHYPEAYTIAEIVEYVPHEPVAVFKEGGFWRCSELEAVNEGRI